MIREIKNKLQLNVKTKILVLGLILVVVIGVFVPIQNTNAQVIDPNIISGLTTAAPIIAQEIAISTPFWLIAEAISSLILRMTAAILQLSGGILDFVLNYTVVNMSAHINGDGANIQPLTGINIAGRIIRDLMNIAFIFLLVFEGIKMIVGQGSVEKIKKFIAMIVLASLLVNFSLFFTKVLIDASNIITIGIYNATIDSTTAQVPGGVLGTGGTGTVRGISAPFMDTLGLQSFYSQSGLNGDRQSRVIMFLMGSVFFLIVSFVFFAVACMFVIRYLVLILLLMLSPIAFMGMALPFMRKYANDWWSALNGQLLFAPVYMILTLIVLTLMASPGFITNGNFSDLLAGGGNSSFGLVFNFAVVIGLAIASLVIAKSTATKGSSMIGSATGKLTAFAGGAILGGTARLGRSTLGRVGDATTRNESLKETASKGGVRGFFAKTALKTGGVAAKSSFDVRATGKFQDLSKTTGISFGKADNKKENFRAIREEQDKKAAEQVKIYKPSDKKYEEAKQTDKVAVSSLDESIQTTKSEEEKVRNDIKTARDNLAGARKKIADLKKEQEENLLLSPERKVEIEQEIKNLNAQAETEKTNLNNFVELTREKNEARRKAEQAKKDYVEKESEEKKLNKIYEERVGRISSATEHEDDTKSQYIWRKTANSIGTLMYVAGAGSLPKTKTDRESIARKIRGATKEKKKLSKKVLKEEFGYDVEEEEKAETPKETTPPETSQTPPNTQNT